MTRRVCDPYSWSVVPKPQRDLTDLVLEFAAPLLDGLEPTSSIEDARGAIELAITFWNASVLASKRWQHPRVKDLNELRKRMKGRQAAPGDAAKFDLLTERWRAYWLDPRLVESWTYDTDENGTPRLSCATGLPDGVKIEVPPPLERRIAIGGRFLDEVRIPLDAASFLSFPPERHRAVAGKDGSVAVHAMMPAALQLFAEGRLPRAGAEPVEVVIGGKDLGRMVLTEVRCGGENLRHDIAVLVFKPASTGGTT